MRLIALGRPWLFAPAARLTTRADMTIAAGILCSDGIIVCADTEHTGDVSKFQASKIIPIDEHTFLTGAGTTDYIRMTADKLRVEMKCARPVNVADARDIVERVVAQVHMEHIFNIFQVSDPSRPYMELIVATRCSGGDLALLKTNNTAVRIGDAFEFAGSGLPIFEYWCRYFYRDRLTMEGMASIVMFMLKEVKKVHPYCGGGSHIYYLSKTFDTPTSHRFFSEADLLVGFPESIVQILSACFFEDTPSAWIDAQLQEFASEVKKMYQSESLRRKVAQEQGFRIGQDLA